MPDLRCSILTGIKYQFLNSRYFSSHFPQFPHMTDKQSLNGLLSCYKHLAAI